MTLRGSIMAQGLITGNGTHSGLNSVLSEKEIAKSPSCFWGWDLL